MFKFSITCLYLLLILTACNPSASTKKNVPYLPTEPMHTAETIIPPSNPAVPILTAYKEGISANGEEMRVGEVIEFASATARFSFNGESTFYETVGGVSKKDYRNIKTIACIALLPLCPAIMSINTEGNAKTIRKLRRCEGSFDFELYADAKFVAKIEDDEATPPTLVIKEQEPNHYRSGRSVLDCETIEELID